MSVIPVSPLSIYGKQIRNSRSIENHLPKYPASALHCGLVDKVQVLISLVTLPMYQDLTR